MMLMKLTISIHSMGMTISIVAERSFDKSITTIRIAMNSLSEIINGVEHDWIIHEILMQHRNMLHSPIDLLLKEKRKL
jgi:ParB family transcriptional regulator, chromosome partitioning protein